ncbi:MAG: hypothetical protein IK008_06055 [Bacteroidales bacterium]|nr:hypothetical protein [Bacteroidales bacterium]
MALLSCGPSGHLREVRREHTGATLSLSSRELEREQRFIKDTKRDTVRVTDFLGTRMYVMKAERDSVTGEMVASDVLDAAVVTARFRHVAERHGRVDLRFEITVPEKMQSKEWQLRFYPDLFMLGDSVRLEPLVITGQNYRSGQLRGYQHYRRFLSRIITDSTRFVDRRNLEIFIERNLPELYRLRSDSTYLTDEQFRSALGVTGKEATDHYTLWWLRRRNERLLADKDRMYRKYVKVPIVTEGIRLDTVIRSVGGDIVYHYTQTIATRPGLRKADVTLSGDIWEGDARLYSMNRTEPLTFYISSLSAFADDSDHYLTRIIERRSSANDACYIAFKAGDASLDESLGNNATEMARIRVRLMELIENEKFDVDSIVISAYASPEGRLRGNESLSRRRAASVAAYCAAFAGDSISFRSRSRGENWDLLSFLVDTDSTLTEADKNSFLGHLEMPDPDRRERALSCEPYYPYLRKTLYPLLRSVRFDFFLHRKGMQKDTVHTTELDTLYMKGVSLLKDRDYKAALECLRDYRDFNTAVAYVALDCNASAMAILQEQEKTPAVNYMMALLYARAGEDEKAVQHYLDACRADASLVFRGNLDPEINVLIRRYGLHELTDQPFNNNTL